MTRLASRLIAGAAVLAASVALALAAAPAASAHVKVDASSTAAGGYTVLTFRVPTESATASTVSLTVQLPTEHPFTSVTYQPVPGWTAKLVTTKLAKPLTDDDGNTIDSAVTQVVWTATGGGLAPGQFGQFPLSVGPLPDAGTLFLPTEQKYSDGSVVDWSQQAQGGAEAEHPAPSVVVTKPAAGGTATAADVSASQGSSAAQAAPAASPVDGWALGFGVAGVVVALAASGAAAVALRRARS
ncbi:YcnI family protein [Gryllotalpicola koreensis]|uniref:YncI copper-binding domain-containing protein n=1 Tax=Gryllotalpicola koreensis TaxID=993086 RepID=A0ABP8A5X3_9MICO